MRKYWLEILLILTAALLVGQIASPTAVRWWRRPVAGAIGIDTFEPNSTIADGYAVYLPEDYEKGTRSWPLVVFLHGSGERGHAPTMLSISGPLALVRNGAQLPAIIVAPQCLPNSSWDPKTVIRFVDHVTSRYQVDLERVYLVGFSMGGNGTWATAADYPERFAAIVPICGGADPDWSKSLTAIPIWAFHGANDNIVPLSQSERMIDAIRAAGGQPRLTVISDAAHGICDRVCKQEGLWEWLIQQVRRLPNSQPEVAHAQAVPDS